MIIAWPRSELEWPVAPFCVGVMMIAGTFWNISATVTAPDSLKSLLRQRRDRHADGRRSADQRAGHKNLFDRCCRSGLLRLRGRRAGQGQDGCGSQKRGAMLSGECSCVASFHWCPLSRFWETERNTPVVSRFPRSPFLVVPYSLGNRRQICRECCDLYQCVK